MATNAEIARHIATSDARTLRDAVRVIRRLGITFDAGSRNAVCRALSTAADERARVGGLSDRTEGDVK